MADPLNSELANYIGKNLVHLIDRDEDDAYCFRLHKDRVYYLPLPMLHLATSVARPNLISLGTCFGRFSKSGKFKLGITSLDWLAKYAKYKVCQLWSSFGDGRMLMGWQVWVKPSGELPFLYGNHVAKAHLGRITEDTPEHQGVVVYNMTDVPLVSG